MPETGDGVVPETGDGVVPETGAGVGADVPTSGGSVSARHCIYPFPLSLQDDGQQHPDSFPAQPFQRSRQLPEGRGPDASHNTDLLSQPLHSASVVPHQPMSQPRYLCEQQASAEGVTGAGVGAGVGLFVGFFVGLGLFTNDTILPFGEDGSKISVKKPSMMKQREHPPPGPSMIPRSHELLSVSSNTSLNDM